MSEDMHGDDPSTRVGFRDIYRAVGESEARIVAALNAAIAPLGSASADHELRLRAVEIHVAASADKDRRLDDVERLAEGTASAVGSYGAKGSAVAATFSGFQKLVIGVAAAAAIVATLVDIGVRLGNP